MSDNRVPPFSQIAIAQYEDSLGMKSSSPSDDPRLCYSILALGTDGRVYRWVRKPRAWQILPNTELDHYVKGDTRDAE